MEHHQVTFSPGLAVRSQKEVASLLGISRQAVAKIEKRALAKLRGSLLVQEKERQNIPYR
jgi:DNA-directed RNA polymerase sigma subunit (sigma70/sigma32)